LICGLSELERAGGGREVINPELAQAVDMLSEAGGLMRKIAYRGRAPIEAPKRGRPDRLYVSQTLVPREK
jgi:hypothetical protein